MHINAENDPGAFARISGRYMVMVNDLRKVYHMTLDTPYDQMMHILSARGLEWVRRHVDALPDPLPAGHDAVAPLSQAARLAPVCSGLRGSVSPLEIFVRRRLDDRLVAEVCDLIRRKGAEPEICDTLAAAQGLGLGGGALYRAIRDFCDRDDLDLAAQLALQTRPAPPLLTAAEEWLCRPLSAAALTADRADLFGRLVMQIYGFGAQRPKLSTARAYGEIFENCLRIADWALRRKDLTVLARIIYCICLIDPDHDVGPWLSDIVASQRPDGSFPDRTGFGTQDQDFAVAGRSTIAAVAALHMVRYRRWHKPPPDRMAA